MVTSSSNITTTITSNNLQPQKLATILRSRSCRDREVLCKLFFRLIAHAQVHYFYLVLLFSLL